MAGLYDSLVNTKRIQKTKNPIYNLGQYSCPSEFCSSYLRFHTNRLCRRNRVTVLEKEAIVQDTEQALLRKEQEAEERRKQSHDLVAESIKRELAESEQIPSV